MFTQNSQTVSLDDLISGKYVKQTITLSGSTETENIAEIISNSVNTAIFEKNLIDYSTLNDRLSGYALTSDIVQTIEAVKSELSSSIELKQDIIDNEHKLNPNLISGNITTKISAISGSLADHSSNISLHIPSSGISGQYLMKTVSGQVWNSIAEIPRNAVSGQVLTWRDGQAVWESPKTGIHIGTIFPYALSEAPAGAFVLNGQSINKNAYPEFAEWFAAAVSASTIRCISKEDWLDEKTQFGHTGAFSQDDDYIYLPDLTNAFVQGAGAGEIGITLSAGLLNIFGDSDIVQPLTVKYPWCIQVYNNVINDSNVDVEAALTELQNKVDVSLNNLPANIDYVVSAQYNEDTSGSTIWYRLYKSGWLEQGGHSPGGSYTYKVINFLRNFSDNKYTLNVSCTVDSNDTSSAPDLYAYIAGGGATYDYGQSSTGFRVSKKNTSAYGFNWYACGQLSGQPIE